MSGKRFGNARDHFFHLMGKCDSDYIMFCDQDDVWNFDKIRITYNEMKKREKIKIFQPLSSPTLR